MATEMTEDRMREMEVVWNGSTISQWGTKGGLLPPRMQRNIDTTIYATPLQEKETLEIRRKRNVRRLREEPLRGERCAMHRMQEWGRGRLR